MFKLLKHFITITKHKLLVGRLCIKCGQVRRGLLHDNSKYSPIEFFSGVRYYQGNRSPIEAEKEDKGYSTGWLHHKGHNPHHWEYWIDNSNTKKIIIAKIPYNYVVEMVCDWVAASIIYSKRKINFNIPYAAPQNYYKAHTETRIFDEDT